VTSDPEMGEAVSRVKKKTNHPSRNQLLEYSSNRSQWSWTPDPPISSSYSPDIILFHTHIVPSHR